MKYLVFICSFLLAFLVATTSSSAEGDPPLTSYGVWTLKDLGYSDIYLPFGEGIVLRNNKNLAAPPSRFATPVKYTLPEGVSQGSGEWYLLHFHFEVELDPQTPDGKLTVLANTNGPMSAAMIRFYVSHENGIAIINWKSLGLTEGWQEGTSNSGKVEIRFSSYLPNDGVKPGDNFLLFALKEEGGIKTSMFHVFEDTSIEITPLSPPSLSIEAEGWHPPVGPGDSFEVDYTIKNTGGWPAKDVVAKVSYPEESLQLVGDPAITMPQIDGSDSQRGKFTFKVLSPGTHNIRVDANSGNGGHAAVQLTATIDPQIEDKVSKTRFWLLLAGVLTLSVLPLIPYRSLWRWLVRQRRRLSRDSQPK